MTCRSVAARATLLFTISWFCLSLTSHAAPPTDGECRLEGSFGYRYEGTSATSGGPLTLTETGYFAVDRAGAMHGEGVLIFHFENFNGQGPLWLTIRETQTQGAVRPNTVGCMGHVSFTATGVVTASSNPALVPEGTTLFRDVPRSVAYTIAGDKHETLYLVSTSPGTVATGTATRQKPR